MLRLVLFDPDLRAMLARERIFQHQSGCRIVQADGPDDLVRLARGGRPHVVIADADLLAADLEPTLAQLKRSAPLRGTPVFVTAAPRPAAEDRLVRAGADAVLWKPVGKQRFYDLIRAAASAVKMEIRVPAGVEVAFTVGNRERSGRVANLSRGGLYLETDNPSPVGTKLTIRFALPAFSNTIHANGIVTWLNDAPTARATQVPKGMGIKFVETPLVSQKTIALYVMLSKDVVRIT
ncbi:MAG TPA: PilZ domain-containing protein [Thermodesulfobacteriota bacterium]